MRKIALLVVDLQIGMLKHVKNSKAVLKAVNQTIRMARDLQCPVFYFKYIDTEKDLKRFGSYWTPEGSPESELHPDLMVAEDDLVYEKSEYSAFVVPEFSEELKRREVESLWLTGAMAQVCVLMTSADAYARDYEVVVVREAVGAYSQANWEMGMLWMEKYSSKVVSIDELV